MEYIQHFCKNEEPLLVNMMLIAFGQRNYTMRTTAWPTTSNSTILQFILWISQCVRYVHIAYASEVLDVIQKLINQIRLFCLSTIFKKVIEKRDGWTKKRHGTWAGAHFLCATVWIAKSFSHICMLLSR